MASRRTARILQITVLLCADTAVAALLLLEVSAWSPDRALRLLCGDTITGVVITILALATITTRSRSLAGITLVLAWLRLLGVPVAAVLLPSQAGSASTGSTQAFVIVLALADAAAGLAAAYAANRCTRD